MVKRLTIRVDTETYAALWNAIESIPAGERNARICAALNREFGQEAADLAQAVHRLASAIEQLPRGVVPREDSAPTITPKPKPTLQRMAEDPEFAGQVRESLLGGWG